MKIDIENFAEQLVVDAFYMASYDAKSLTPGEFKGRMLMKCRTGGSSGGSCWGDRTTPFYVETHERQEEIQSSIESGLRTLFNVDYYAKDDIHNIKGVSKDIIESMWGNHEIASFGDYSDYYGNGTDYQAVGYPIDEIFDILISKGMVSEDDKQNFSQIYDEKFAAKELEFNVAAYEVRLHALNGKVQSFEKDMKDKLKSLESRKVSLAKEIENIDKQIKNFNKTKKATMDTMQKEISHLNEFLSENKSKVKTRGNKKTK